jgi:hypothetical protein
MTLDDTYVDFISVMPHGSVHYFKNKLKSSTVNEMNQVFTLIHTHEMQSYLYNFNEIYKYKIDELVQTMKNELVYRSVNQKENRYGLSSKAPEFVPVTNRNKQFNVMGSRQFNQ